MYAARRDDLARDPDSLARLGRGDFDWAITLVKTGQAEQAVALLNWSHDADHVLDLHCDHHSVVHLYASPARPEDTSLLCRCIGARLALIESVSGGNAFDEAHSAPWAQLK